VRFQPRSDRIRTIPHVLEAGRGENRHMPRRARSAAAAPANLHLYKKMIEFREREL
jgi:hypothetical protein